MSADPHGTYERRRIYEFMVESLIFAYDYLTIYDYKPVQTDEDFYIGDAEGKELPPTAADAMAQALEALKGIAPAAVRALDKYGQEDDEGRISTAAVLDAYERWNAKQPPQTIMEG